MMFEVLWTGNSEVNRPTLKLKYSYTTWTYHYLLQSIVLLPVAAPGTATLDVHEPHTVLREMVGCASS